MTLFVFSVFSSNAQNKLNGLLWDKIENKPVEFATIHNKNNNVISNENGRFFIRSAKDSLYINILGYETKQSTFQELKKVDTIFLKPKMFILDEVVITKEDNFKKMLKTVLTDYPLQLHKEKFFLRCLVKKNDKILKLVDFSGLLERKTLFDTKSKPMPKRNYQIQVENIRKSGVINRTYDFEMFSFTELLQRIASIYLSPKIYDFDYLVSKDSLYYKIKVSPKETSKTKTVGYYHVNKKTNTFEEVYVKNSDNDAPFSKKRKIKFRTVDYELKTNFKRSNFTNKYQINKSILKARIEVVTEKGTDFLDAYYYWYAIPQKKDLKVKNNVNFKRDIFDLKGKYNKEYWAENEVLILSDEMQQFINKVNKKEKNKEFRTKTNIK